MARPTSRASPTRPGGAAPAALRALSASLSPEIWLHDRRLHLAARRCNENCAGFWRRRSGRTLRDEPFVYGQARFRHLNRTVASMNGREVRRQPQLLGTIGTPVAPLILLTVADGARRARIFRLFQSRGRVRRGGPMPRAWLDSK